MGADLYIKKSTKKANEKYHPLFDKAVEKRNAAKTDKQNEKWQKKVTEYYNAMYPDEGYFRDSYNATSVLWTLGLSWWEDVAKILNSKGNLSRKNLSLFIHMVENAKQTLPTKADLLAEHCTIEDDGENSVEGWHKYYKDKREALLKFLKSARNQRLAIYCSI
ncbi:MAG: hypothetical protein ACTSWQ_03955 [Candidatus Thorarchaeota archaeon]